MEQLIQSDARFAIDDLALVEVVHVLERVMRLERRLIADAVRTVLSTAAFECDRRLWSPIVEHYVERPKLSITDIRLVARAVDRDSAPLLTFDRELAAQLDGAELL